MWGAQQQSVDAFRPSVEGYQLCVFPHTNIAGGHSFSTLSEEDAQTYQYSHISLGKNAEQSKIHGNMCN